MSKILLVEDNEMNRDMLTRRLERKVYEVVIAVDGQAGIDMASSASPDIILMDLSLPVIDGWEATDQGQPCHAVNSGYCTDCTCHGGRRAEGARGRLR